MRISARLSAIKGTSWRDNLTRFALGGAITVAAALIAAKLGPIIGGLFLAFPAIFPASATLIEKREKRKMAAVGRDGTTRGRRAAALEARGTCFGCLGLAAFAGMMWVTVADHTLVLSLLLSTAVWVLVSVLLWRFAGRWPAVRGRLLPYPQANTEHTKNGDTGLRTGL